MTNEFGRDVSRQDRRARRVSHRWAAAWSCSRRGFGPFVHETHAVLLRAFHARQFLMIVAKLAPLRRALPLFLASTARVKNALACWLGVFARCASSQRRLTSS